MSNFAEIFQPLSEEKVRSRQELARLEEQCLHPRCGNCDNWMKKSVCPPEGKGRKMSMSNGPCGSYALDYHDRKRLKDLRKAV